MAKYMGSDNRMSPEARSYLNSYKIWCVDLESDEDDELVVTSAKANCRRRMVDSSGDSSEKELLEVPKAVAEAPSARKRLRRAKQSPAGGYLDT